MSSRELAIRAVKDNGMCGRTDNGLVCLLPLGHDEPHGWVEPQPGEEQALEKKVIETLEAAHADAVKKALDWDAARIRAVEEKEELLEILRQVLAEWDKTENAKWEDPACVALARRKVCP
jgi:hypothetical protein